MGGSLREQFNESCFNRRHDEAWQELVGQSGKSDKRFLVFGVLACDWLHALSVHVLIMPSSGTTVSFVLLKLETTRTSILYLTPHPLKLHAGSTQGDVRRASCVGFSRSS